ncbi:MAG TPA: hypothetical protein VM146_00970 [Steroidobacteraceae bacterium]|nr:hypothetical protein [Steroidobacteraceae bacterium]
MTDEFETQLRRALRPVDAPEGFTEKLMGRLPKAEPANPPVVVVALPSSRPAAPALRPTRNFVLPAALAASLVAAVMLGQHMGQLRDQARQQREIAEGREASRELMQALRVTSQKLDMAYQAVTNPPSTSAGEEENPS